MHASYKVFVCYKLRFKLIYGNHRAERTEPSIRSARFGLGRDETEHRPTSLGRTEIETEHPLAPRDWTEISNLYPETSPSSTQSRFTRFIRRPDCRLVFVLQENQTGSRISDRSFSCQEKHSGKLASWCKECCVAISVKKQQGLKECKKVTLEALFEEFHKDELSEERYMYFYLCFWLAARKESLDITHLLLCYQCLWPCTTRSVNTRPQSIYRICRQRRSTGCESSGGLFGVYISQDVCIHSE